MNGVEILHECRQRLLAMDEIVARIRDAEGLQVEEARGYLDELNAEHQRMRLSYVEIFRKALIVLENLKGAQRSVLWRYYVMGQTENAVANSLNYVHRYVQRVKKEGLRLAKKIELE